MCSPRLGRLAACHLALYPGISLLHSGPQANSRFPAEGGLYRCVVAVATADTLRRLEVVAARELNPCDFLRDIDETVYRHQLGAAQVNGVTHVGVHDRLRAVEAVVDVHEAAGLL